MADNFIDSHAQGGSAIVLASDDISDVHYQILKLAFGALNTATLVSSSNGLPVNVVAGATNTQYTEGDTDASITGTAMMMEGAGDALVAAQGTAANGLEVDVTRVTGTVTVDGSGVTQPVSAASLPLPSGASTAAKQPALGTAGVASADVITIQGVASMTPLLVNGSAVTQPVSHAALTELAAAINASSQMDVNILGSSATITIDAPFASNEDAVHLSGDGGVPMLAVRDDTPAGLAADGDYINLTTDSLGRLWVHDDVMDAALAGSELQVDVVAALPAGTNAIGKLAANSGVDIGDVDVTSISAGANLIGDVGIQPRTTNGLTTFMASGSDGSSILVATAQVIKASAGKLYGYYAYNPEAAVTFLHFYNTAAASVTVGTTNPLFTLVMPGGSAANLMSDIGITFSNAGWSCAATTTAGGNTAPATGISLVAWYA